MEVMVKEMEATYIDENKPYHRHNLKCYFNV